MGHVAEENDQFSCPLTCEPCCIEGYKYSAVYVRYPVGHVAEENGQFLPEIWSFINHRAHDPCCSLVETVYSRVDTKTNRNIFLR